MSLPCCITSLIARQFWNILRDQVDSALGLYALSESAPVIQVFLGYLVSVPEAGKLSEQMGSGWGSNSVVSSSPAWSRWLVPESLCSQGCGRHFQIL